MCTSLKALCLYVSSLFTFSASVSFKVGCGHTRPKSLERSVVQHKRLVLVHRTMFCRIECTRAILSCAHENTVVYEGGARVIQIGGGTRELYYYPKGTVQVMVVGDDIKKGD